MLIACLAFPLSNFLSPNIRTVAAAPIFSSQPTRNANLNGFIIGTTERCLAGKSY